MISFVAPIMVLLLSIFSKGISLIKKKYEEEQKQIQTVIANQLANVVDYGALSKTIRKSSKSLRWSERWNNYKLNLLNPMRQLVRIGCALGLSLILIMSDMVIKDKTFGLYHHGLSVTLIILSFLFLVMGMIFLLQIGWVTILAKAIIAEDETAEKLGKEITEAEKT